MSEAQLLVGELKSMLEGVPDDAEVLVVSPDPHDPHGPDREDAPVAVRLDRNLSGGGATFVKLLID